MSEQRETGWHMHEDVVMNDRSCIGLHSARDHHLERVLVVPVGEARAVLAILDALEAEDDYVRSWKLARQIRSAAPSLAALAAPAPSGALHETEDA